MNYLLAKMGATGASGVGSTGLAGSDTRAQGKGATIMPGHIRFKARGRTVRRVPGQPNKLEQQYGDHLKWRKHTGEILQYEF
ncbi:MAG: hypothetical protein ACKVP2_01710, partial [Burkholderiales bacterium]